MQPSTWQDQQRQFAQQLALSEVREESTPGAPPKREAARIDERLVQAIWFDQMLRSQDLVTASGKALEVLEPGRWNTGRGPDFQGARIRLAGTTIEGDVEIHINSVDWERHGHHQDYEYNRVILHAVLNPNDDRPYEEKQNGQRLERLVLRDVLEPDLDTIRGSVNLSDYPYGDPDDLGRCHQQFLRLPPEQLEEFLLAAGMARIDGKIARLDAQRATANMRQVLYQSLMTAQGYKSSKTLYFLLSKRAPFEELLDFARDVPPEKTTDLILSTLLHTARLAPEQGDFLEDSDEETRTFLQSMKDLWRPVRPYFSDRFLPPTKRWFSGMRPAGFPTRRLAAVAVLLARMADRQDPLLERLKSVLNTEPSLAAGSREWSKFWKATAEVVSVEGEAHYFSTHFTLGGKKQSTQALLGAPAAMSLLFNLFLPYLVLEARIEKNRERELRYTALLKAFPSLEKNSVIRFMERRLFGDSQAVKGLLRREVFQQGLIAVFNDCCAGNERSCEQCTLFALAERLRGRSDA